MVEDPPGTSSKSCNRRCVLFVGWDRFPFCSVINILKGNTFWKRCFVEGGGSLVYASDDSPVMDGWWMDGWMDEGRKEGKKERTKEWMNEWMIDWLIDWLIDSISTSWTSRGASEGNIRSDQRCYHGPFTWKSFCPLRFPITHPVPTPAPIQKDLLRYLWFIYQSIYIFIHLYLTIPTLSPIIMEMKKWP